MMCEMGGRREKNPTSHTLRSSPSHSLSSSSSSDFEFNVPLSPRNSSSVLCPADELFYKGQLLPLNLSPRLSMVRALFLASSSVPLAPGTTTTASRDSTGSSDDSHSSFSNDLASECDSSRPSSVSEEDEFKRLQHPSFVSLTQLNTQIKKSTDFSLSRFPFVKRVSATAKEVTRKYVKKVKRLYGKLSQKQQQQQKIMGPAMTMSSKTERSIQEKEAPVQIARKDGNGGISNSFSRNLRYPRWRTCASSCTLSIRSSPSHSGVLSKPGFLATARPDCSASNFADASSMEELESAIAHCKNSLAQSKAMVSNEI